MTTKKANPESIPTNGINEVIHNIVENTNIKVEKGIDALDDKGKKKTAGRPIDPNSPRQKRLLELEIKRQLNLSRRGRPVDGNSDRQQRLAEMEVRRQASGGILKPGRPAMTEEEKDKAAKERKERQEANAKMIAEKAKKQLIKAGLLDEDGKPVTPVSEAVESGK
jgi:hypothetical protein